MGGNYYGNCQQPYYDMVLYVEECLSLNIIFPYRQVLSSDHIEVHQAAVVVNFLVVKAAQQVLDEEKRMKNKHKGTVTQMTPTEILKDALFCQMSL